MVSDFRKKKLLYVFTFFDTDGSGSIEKKDFDAAIEGIAKTRGWSAGDANYTYVKETLNKIWEGIQSGADADNDGQVTQDEWIAMWENYSKNPAAAADWQNLYCKFTFSLEDTTNDGSISSDEFLTLYTPKISKDDALKAFQKMSKGKSEVSFDDFQELWKEYFSSEDVNAPGNFIFAKLSF